MERNSSLTLKDRHQRNNINNINTPKDQYSWSHVYNNNQSYEEDSMMNGFSWPPRSYTCSFCRREFRSAQALGGHMNVHRKDRARLRQSPPRSDHGGGRYGSGTTFLNLNLNPSFSTCHSLLTAPLSSLTSPPLSSLTSSPYSAYNCPNNESKKWPWTGHHVEYRSTNQLDALTYINGSDLAKSTKNKQSVCGVEEHDGFAGKNIMQYCKSLNKADQTTAVRLDLEIGLLGADSKMGRDLDLELRLGYSN